MKERNGKPVMMKQIHNLQTNMQKAIRNGGNDLLNLYDMLISYPDAKFRKNFVHASCTKLWTSHSDIFLSCLKIYSLICSYRRFVYTDVPNNITTNLILHYVPMVNYTRHNLFPFRASKCLIKSANTKRRLPLHQIHK